MTDVIGDAFAKRKIKGLHGLSFASYEMGWLDAKKHAQDATIREYQRRERIAREALEFYNNGLHYTEYHEMPENIKHIIVNDRGEKAQQALKQLGGETK